MKIAGPKCISWIYIRCCKFKFNFQSWVICISSQTRQLHSSWWIRGRVGWFSITFTIINKRTTKVAVDPRKHVSEESATHDAMSALFCDLPCQMDLIRSYSYRIPPRTRTKLPTHHVSLPAEPNTVCLLIHIYVDLPLCPQPLYSILFVKRIPRNVCIYYNTKQMGGPKAPSLSSQI